MTDPRGYVYFVSCGSAVKIGWSGGDPKIRMRDLQVGNPHRLTLLHVAIGDRKQEKTLHRALKFCRLKGEWFAISPRMISTVQEILADPGALADVEGATLGEDERFERRKKMLCEASDLLSNPDISSADFDKAIQLMRDAGIPDIGSHLLQGAVAR